ncbi:acyl-CoA dehydrogenase [Gordonia sp. PKS22-38]|uniref:Acyl-CoA dehydrogenase n=1 Tax=Gordonia prachuapensis TaxID=3115651 RepID=A0ABU7MRL4_9ACTN|nr:acyl-CoA dehydrogenase [Gordonia sp. PKS22-38]
MSIALTEDHIELASVVRDFTVERKVRAEARTLLDSEDEPLPPFWQDMADLGWLGLHVPEEFGGSGYGIAELVVVVEELGRAVAPGPFLPTVIASAIVGQADDPARGRWLRQLADGSITAGIGLSSDLNVSEESVAGEVRNVLGAPLANIILVVCNDDVLLVEASDTGVGIDARPNLDPTRRCAKVSLSDATVTVLAGLGSTALALARTLVAAEAVGGAREALDTAVAYAKVREQFGRTIGSFQAVKHHCANMLVGAETATAAVWDAARAADEQDDAFALAAASAAVLALPAYSANAELNIQVHGGIGFTWEHDAHLHLRRATVLKGLFGGQSPARNVFDLTATGPIRANSLDLPAEAEEMRAGISADIRTIAAIDDDTARREKLIETGYVMPHWPRPWGRAADAVEQLVIEEEMTAAELKRPDYSITGWVILTLIQQGTQDQIDRFVKPALRGDEVWCQLFSEPDAGSDAAAVKTRAVREDGGWRINGQKVWTSGAHLCKRGLATVRTDRDAPKHKGITTVIIDMSAPGVEVRPLRQITGGAEFNEVFFTDVFIPDADVVGTPNEGWTVARATLGNERVSIGGGSGGEDTVAYILGLAERYAHRVDGSRARIGEFLAVENALRLLNLRRAARSVVGAEPGPEGNVTKLLLAEHIGDRARLSAELLGPDIAYTSGAGQMAGLLVLAARGITIAGGTSEITRNQIAERILGLPRDPLIR